MTSQEDRFAAQLGVSVAVKVNAQGDSSNLRFKGPLSLSILVDQS